MKIDRLIGILSILLQRDQVSSQYLAETFEVSRRTILRDVETLSQAGIPILTTQGQKGGISILGGYKLDRTLFTPQEMQAILAGLRSLDSVCGTGRYRQLGEKLWAGGSSVLASPGSICIDLASWYKTDLAPKIALLQEAVEARETVKFVYCSPGGERTRTVEPNLLVFQWSSWYLWGYCRLRQTHRLFKLNRMLELEKGGEQFPPRRTPPPDLSAERVFPDRFPVRVRFTPSQKWRLVDDFGVNSFQEQADGSLLFQFDFSDREHLFRWLTSFGPEAELLEPAELREAYLDQIRGILRRYTQT